MNTLEPRQEVLATVRTRVFESVAAQSSTPAISPIQTVFSSRIFSGIVFAPVGMAFAIVLVVANQLPLQSAYRDSISSIATSQQIAESLKNEPDSLAAVQAVKVTTANTRKTLDGLQLKGQFGMYTESDCLHAYIIYDSYLDYLGGYLDTELPKITDTSKRAAYQDLLAYVKDSSDEVQKRINMYPPTH